MEKYIPGHTDKIIIEYKEKAERKAQRETIKWHKPTRAYKCHIGDHWHITTMSKGRYYTNKRKDTRTSDGASNIPT